MSARILLRGGCVHTPADPHATALCVEDGTVTWTGDDDAAENFADGADRIVDLRGRLVTPAFVDAHVHLAQTGFAATGIDLTGAASLHEALDVVAAHANASSATVLLGFGWDETTWPEQRPFTRHELDRATGGRLVLLGRVDEHSAVVSTAFLDACPEVEHAEGYDASGLVTREAQHAARLGLFGLVPASDREEAIRHALREAAREGIAMVHELGAPHISPPEDIAVIRALAAQHVLPDAVTYWGSLDVEQAVLLGCAGAAGDLCADGSIGSRTCALREPYVGTDERGHLYLTAAQVTEHVVACTRAGVQAGFHVIGDHAVAEVVAGLQAAATVVGRRAMRQARHRLEHVEMTDPQQLAVLGELGVTASVQPVFDDLWGGPGSLYARRLGAERAHTMNAFSSMSKAGVALAFGSDSPVTPLGPWGAVRAAAWHRTESERMTVRTAFDAHTRGGWRAARRDEGGVIAVGAPASIAVWDVPGPWAGGPHLPDLHPAVDLPTCVMTLVAGEPAFEHEGALT